MMITIFAVFLLTTALYGSLLFLAFRRVFAHLQGNAEATKHVVDHVLIPLLGANPKQPWKRKRQSRPCRSRRGRRFRCVGIRPPCYFKRKGVTMWCVRFFITVLIDIVFGRNDKL